MGLLSKVLGVPTIGKAIIRFLKRRGFKPLQISIDKAREKQMIRLRKKFRRMEGTEIGRKLDVRSGIKLRDLPMTDYNFYSSFFENPTPSAFMYPLEEYVRVRTSGTSGIEKWYMIPKKEFSQGYRETGVLILLSLFHDGEKITLEYGDVYYVNLAPRPFVSGTMQTEEDTSGIINMVPNINLSYEDKVQYLINNYEKIDAATLLASTIISQVMPSIGKPIRLKGLNTPDTAVAEVYRKKLEEFTGAVPKNLYGSTETLHPSIFSVQYPLGCVVDWRRGFFEFLPVKDSKAVEGETVGLEDLKPGEVYELIYTSFLSELTRYKTGDALLCVARGEDILGIDFPVLKFHARLDKRIALHNFTRISEEELLIVLKEADVSFTNFTTKIEIDKGLEHLKLFIDHRGEMTSKEVEERIHNKLMNVDEDYRDLVDFFKYMPIKVQTVPTEAFMEYLREKTGIPKIPKIKMDKKEFERLSKIIEKHKKG